MYLFKVVKIFLINTFQYNIAKPEKESESEDDDDEDDTFGPTRRKDEVNWTDDPVARKFHKLFYH